jgi:hypothetical protein
MHGDDEFQAVTSQENGALKLVRHCFAPHAFHFNLRQHSNRGKQLVGKYSHQFHLKHYRMLFTAPLTSKKHDAGLFPYRALSSIN